MLRHWAEILLELAKTPWGPVVLVVHAFLESFIMPIAHDIFLITVSLARPKWSLFYALLSTTASTLGNMVGYQIGKWGGTPFIERFVKVKTLKLTKEMIHKYDAWATAIACFTPFPDKIFSLCAGAFRIKFKKFCVVIFFSRAARFYLICILLFFYGARVREFLLRYLDAVMVGLIVFMVASAIVWHIFLKWFARRLDREIEAEG
ncbi:MAG TPA: VTT domain-containing protein [Candidatus Omnitrophota bacterium]|nr:VTT domain-containing protein [Candidatus Omnitrophota bacterium]